MEIFDAEFSQGKSPIEIHVNPELGDQNACAQAANKYLVSLGRVPYYLREGLDTVTIHAGNQGWGVGSRNQLIHTGNTFYEDTGTLDEWMAWGLAILTLDGVYSTPEWTQSVSSDPRSISNPALNDPGYSDVTETYLAWYAARKVADTSRVSAEDKALIENGIPARLSYLDEYYQTNFATSAPTNSPTTSPSLAPTVAPTGAPVTAAPTNNPTHAPTDSPTPLPLLNAQVENADSLQQSKAASVGLFSISWVLVILFTLLVVLFRKHPVIVVAQPVFCAMVLAGVALSSISILLFTVDGDVDDETEQSSEVWTSADTACMASVWFFGIGFVLMYSALLVKMKKILYIFNMKYEMGSSSRKKMSVRQNVKLVLGLVAIEVIILLAWTITSPLRYSYTVVNSYQQGDFQVNLNRGLCSSELDVQFLVALASYHIALLAYSMYVAIKTTNIHTAFSEGKYIRFAVYNGLQFSLLAIPILYLTNEASTAMFIRAVAIGLHDAAFLGFLFGPKLLMIIRGTDSEAGDGKEIIARAVETSNASYSSSSGGKVTPQATECSSSNPESDFTSVDSEEAV